jgi:predicted TIM-barrel fold metal-dependent hydrolase
VLEQSRFKDLRVNLAHFGWKQKEGEGFDGDEGWARTICGLIRDFDNVYTDVSHHRVLTKKGRKKFAGHYKTMQNEFADSLDKIKRRILCGSDWHVLRRMRGHETFFDDYRTVMLDSGLYGDPGVEDFLGGNAMEFLGLTPRAQNHGRLECFYQELGIEPPTWFEEVENRVPSPRPEIAEEASIV